MLVATSSVELGNALFRSTILLERRIRAFVVSRTRLAFDTRYAASAGGRPDPVGHVFLCLRGRFTFDRGPVANGPVGVVLADEEMEHVHPRARTFRTDGERVDVIQMRIPREHIRAPIGLVEGPLDLPAAVWDAARAMHAQPTHIAPLIEELARARVLDTALAGTLRGDEPEHFQRLWNALEPLFRTHGASTSLKQLAAGLDMSLRQVGRDAKELADTFGLGGYRDALLVVRLRTACLLLSAPAATVADVARISGYGSAIAMARAFRDAKLPSPSSIQEVMAKSIRSQEDPHPATQEA